MKNKEEFINNSLLQSITKEQVNNMSFKDRVVLCYDVIRKYRIESKNILSLEAIGIIMNRLNIGKIHVMERRNIIKAAMNPFTCEELFKAFDNPEEQLSNENINLIQSSIDFAVNKAVEQYYFVANNDGFGPNDVEHAILIAGIDIQKLKDFLEERNIKYDSEKLDKWLRLARMYNRKINNNFKSYRN